MHEWTTGRVVEELNGPDGRRYAVVELEGQRYGICCEGEPIRAVVWPPDRIAQCRGTARALAGGRQNRGGATPPTGAGPAND